MRVVSTVPSSSYAAIDKTEEIDSRERRKACVYAQCDTSDYVAGPVWGWEAGSVVKVLALLDMECGCGAGRHELEEEEG